MAALWRQLYLDALHGDVVDHPDDAAGPGHSQQRVAGAGVVGPRTRVEVLIRLRAFSQGKTTVLNLVAFQH